MTPTTRLRRGPLRLALQAIDQLAESGSGFVGCDVCMNGIEGL
ncbi:hypothetical protein V475_05035 [Sphingobium baderi LL03]|uniref:Uncharacterized protein n=1 Tax=Sphingobium baderi LL03 TaxID=1114964 RepID=T0GJQ4_9SPHN|nr:hypothetical protein L485_04820 [Sphingobium baderi LL03]KMS63202.1 hypothetical protein V475_05035 [Sphingobium baderi LL03]